MVLGQLVPCGGGDPIELIRPRLLIGRRSQCDIILEFPNVSSQHCELRFDQGYWQIRDLGSRNGIKVNGTRCESKWLMPGDTVSIAKHHYKIAYSPAGTTPPPDDEDVLEQSLLEKAGLVRRDPDRCPERPHRMPRAVAPPRESNGSADDELAMKFLTEGEETP